MIATNARPTIRHLAALVLAALPVAVGAHPGARERLELLSQEIAADPSDAELYLRRGQVYHHEDRWDAALADYQRAAELGIDPDLADLARGETLQQAGRPAQARGYLDRLLARRPDHPRALLLRGRALSTLGRAAAAADDYSRALDLSPRASPDFYLEVVRALRRAKRDGEALKRTDEGLERLGPLSVLAAAAIDIEVANGRYERALERLDRIAAGSGFAERWLVRRAEILELRGSPEEACEAFEAALEALERRPENRRSTRILRQLEQRARDGRNRQRGGCR